MDAIEPYVRQLVDRHRQISEVWLIGSRANGTSSADSDWDLVVFGPPDTFCEIQRDSTVHREDVDLLYVYDQDNFQSAWGAKEKTGSLTEWGWAQKDSSSATYRAAKPRYEDDGSESFAVQTFTARGIRIWSDETAT